MERMAWLQEYATRAWKEMISGRGKEVGGGA